MKKCLVLGLVLLGAVCGAQNPTLWGMATAGGANGAGTIFSYDLSTNIYAVQHNFDSATGSAPYGSLIQANNGLLYGMTSLGGTYNYGVLFSYDITTSIYKDLYNFAYDDTIAFDGIYPHGSLLQGKDGLLYGMATNGGYHHSIGFGFGVIFSYNIDAATYNVLHPFSIDSDGKEPYGSLIQGSDSLLYGMTQYGGLNSLGTIFKYDIAAGAETVLFNFEGNNNGPVGNLLQLSDGLFYGMDLGTTGTNNGHIFSFNTVTDTCMVAHSFDIYSNDGKRPWGSLIRATDSLLYGMTQLGGTGNTGTGTIFSYDMLADTETILFNFAASGTGNWPTGSLIQASNGLLYGMTTRGGTGDSGVIFSFNIANDSEIVLYNFHDTAGTWPQGDLLEVTSTADINHLSSANNLSIYPNPTTGQFTIQLSGDQNNYPTEIYNVLGEKVEEVVLSNGQNIINLGNYATGMYFINVHTVDGNATGKVMVVR